jgi:hypothetical protein
MHVIDIYVGENEQRRKRRRAKWLVPLIVGCGAALALGREKPAPAPAPVPKQVVAPAPAVVKPPPVEVVETSTVAVDTQPPPPPVPAHMAVAPARLDFGDGPLTRGVPAQMAVIRNDGGVPLAPVRAIVDGPFMATSGCTEALAPGDQCMIAVVFTPKQPGQFSNSLKIAAGEQHAQVSLRGSVPKPREEIAPARTPVVVTATAPPPVQEPARPQLPPARVLCVPPKQVHFTSTGKQTITVTNPEPVPIRVAAILPIGRQGQTVSGYEVEARRCLRELKPRQQCKFTVRANQLALQRAETMQITVYYDDPVTGTRRAASTSSTCGR